MFKKDDKNKEEMEQTKSEESETVNNGTNQESFENFMEEAAVRQDHSDQASEDWQLEKEELLDQIKRKQADIDNLRRIGKKEQAEAREYALHHFLCRLLPVIDNLERALESAKNDQSVPDGYVEGIDMIYNQLMQIMEQEGVCKIEAEGCRFDPNYHHAVMQEHKEEEEPGTVLEELQKGYRHRDRVLRPAMVKVCSN
ncbi:MAG: nucleotide exchange factor GrpE [Bacillota bacterium]